MGENPRPDSGEPSPGDTPFAAWLKTQPRGAMTRIWRTSGVSWHSVNYAKKHKVGLKVAVRISRATGGEVPIADLTDDNALNSDPPRSAA